MRLPCSLKRIRAVNTIPLFVTWVLRHNHIWKSDRRCIIGIIKHAGPKYEMIILWCSSPLLIYGVDLPNVVRPALTCVSLTRTGYNAKCWLINSMSATSVKMPCWMTGQIFCDLTIFLSRDFLQRKVWQEPNYLVTADMTVQCINAHGLCEFSTRCSWGNCVGNCVPSSGVFPPAFIDHAVMSSSTSTFEDEGITRCRNAQWRSALSQENKRLTHGKGKAIPIQVWAAP